MTERVVRGTLCLPFKSRYGIGPVKPQRSRNMERLSWIRMHSCVSLLLILPQKVCAFLIHTCAHHWCSQQVIFGWACTKVGGVMGDKTQSPSPHPSACWRSDPMGRRWNTAKEWAGNCIQLACWNMHMKSHFISRLWKVSMMLYFTKAACILYYFCMQLKKDIFSVSQYQSTACQISLPKVTVGICEAPVLLSNWNDSLHVEAWCLVCLGKGSYF